MARTSSAAAVTACAAAAVLLGAGFRPRPQTSPNAADAAKFDVISIKVDPNATGGVWSGHLEQGRFMARGAPVKFLLQEAFGVGAEQIAGMPDWANSMAVVIEARAPADTPDSSLQPMLRNMFVDRFQMVWHTETRPVEGRELVVAKGGPKLQAASAPCVKLDASQPLPKDQHRCGSVELARKWLAQLDGAGTAPTQLTYTGYSVSMADLVKFVVSPRGAPGTPVIDQTNLSGVYDFTFSFPQTVHVISRDSPMPPAEPVVTFADMLKKVCGLELRSAKVSLPVYVIDKLEPPTPN